MQWNSKKPLYVKCLECKKEETLNDRCHSVNIEWQMSLCSVFTFPNTLGCLYTLAFSTEAYVTTTTTTFKGSADD